MKLSKSTRSTSFYEVFSDLIFGTMAIFILIVIVLTLQVRPEGVPMKDFEKVAQEAQTAKAARERLSQQIEQMKADAQSKPLDLVIAVDGSSSMGAALSTLQFAIRTLAEALPMISPDVHIGVVVYRSKASSVVLPLTRMLKPEQDGGQSLEQVYRFTEQMQPEAGFADLSYAVEQATLLFAQEPRSGSRKRTLMIVGDIGPYEEGGDYIDAAGEQRIKSLMTAWMAQGPNSSIIAVYTGGNSQDEWIVEQRLRTTTFFRDMAVLGGSDENFSPEDRKIFPLLLKGILK